MMANNRHSFYIATSALLSGSDPAVVGPDLHRTDLQVNEAQRAIRRELVVHASVHGTSQVPAILTYMSVDKDVERIGDYAKNIYDLAAMGAQPRWCTLALTIAAVDEQWLEGFTTGFFRLAEAHEVSLVGGDLTRGPLSATLQLIGSVDTNGLMTRSGAHVGDDVYVTGTLGDAAAGLALINEDAVDAGPEHRALVERF